MDILKRIPTPIVLALKEAGRIVIMAIVSYVLAYMTALPQTEAVLIGTIILRAADKFLHDLGKETGNTTLKRGITQF